MQQLPSAWSLTYLVAGGCRYSDNDVRPAAQLPAPTGPVVLNGQMTGAAPGGGYYASFVDAHGQQQLYYYPPTQPQPQPQTLQHSQSMYAGYVMTPRSSQPHHALLSTSLTWGCLVYLQVCAGVPTSLLPGAPQRLRNAGADVRLPAHAAAAAATAVHGGAWQPGPPQSTPQCRRWWAPRPWHKRTC